MNRKHMPLLAGGLVVLLLAVGLLFWMFGAQGHYAESFSKLTTAQNQLQRLTSRNPFPSAGNVQAMGKQLETYQEYLDGLKAEMRKGQRVAEPVTRDRFRQLLEETLRQLVNGAREKGVVLPANFAFGFQRYAEGVLPAEEEMNRLVDQLYSVKALCEILYAAGINELVAVERTTFEKDAQADALLLSTGERPRPGRGARRRAQRRTGKGSAGTLYPRTLRADLQGPGRGQLARARPAGERRAVRRGDAGGNRQFRAARGAGAEGGNARARRAAADVDRRLAGAGLGRARRRAGGGSPPARTARRRRPGMADRPS